MAHLLQCCSDADLDTLAPLVTLGLHHEQQHQELLLTDILHALWCNPLLPAYQAAAAAPAAAPRRAGALVASARWHHPGWPCRRWFCL